MAFAEVSVNAPGARRRTFSYSIPPHLSVSVGEAVWAPFGQRLVQGILVRLTDQPAVEQVRDISGVIGAEPLLTETQVKLGLWLSDYYLSPLFDALAVMLPPGFERRVLTFLVPVLKAYDESALNEMQVHILTRIQREHRVGLKELEKAHGKKKAQANVQQLVRLGIIAREYDLEPVKIKTKEVQHIHLSLAPAEAFKTLEKMSGARARKQHALLKYLIEHPGPIPMAVALKGAGCDRVTAAALVKKNLAIVEDVAVQREPRELQHGHLSQPLPLTRAQEAVFTPVCQSLRNSVGSKAPGAVFLLHGVTGSGKTEIYLQALAEAVKLGRQGIVLVPEIALTPQTIERFVARFPGRVAVLHSHLSPGEQFDEWHKIRNGGADVVIGPRSAVFAPLPHLGLIIIDEEHEWTYKQHEQSPRYHARTVAIKLNEMTGCTVLMGSATPDVETYYRATRGEIQFLKLPERVTPVENAPLPTVTVIDMREELKENNRSIFSRTMTTAIDKVVENHEQAIIFLNRRGTSTYIQCRNCGFVLRCKRCDIPMTYHTDTESLLCHQCNYHMPVPQVCPRCTSRKIRYLGLGTEKLAQELELSFPKARVLRWDRDVTRGRYSHQRILDKFRAHEADLLVGTQMVAKGLDLPLVTLVGVMNADLSLYIPDFRAGERTFQLLSQVAGRAGRGPVEGHVIVQSYNPEHYAIRAASRHDYREFFDREIEFRRQLREPPFTRLAALLFAHANETRCREEAEKLATRIKEEMAEAGIAGIEIIGPAPAFIHRLRGRYRWQIILRGACLAEFLARIDPSPAWTIDIDPAGL